MPLACAFDPDGHTGGPTVCRVEGHVGYIKSHEHDLCVYMYKGRKSAEIKVGLEKSLVQTFDVIGDDLGPSGKHLK